MYIRTGAAVKLMKTRIGLLAQPKSRRSIMEPYPEPHKSSEQQSEQEEKDPNEAT